MSRFIILLLLFNLYSVAQSDRPQFTSLYQNTHSVLASVGDLVGSGLGYKYLASEWGVQGVLLPYYRVYEKTQLVDYYLDFSLLLLHPIWEGKLQQGSFGPKQSQLYSFIGINYFSSQEQYLTGSLEQNIPLPKQQNDVIKYGLGGGIGLDYSLNQVRFGLGMNLSFKSIYERIALHVSEDSQTLKPGIFLTVQYAWRN